MHDCELQVEVVRSGGVEAGITTAARCVEGEVWNVRGGRRTGEGSEDEKGRKLNELQGK